MREWEEIDWRLVATVFLGLAVLIAAGGIQIYVLSEITTGDSTPGKISNTSADVNASNGASRLSSTQETVENKAGTSNLSESDNSSTNSSETSNNDSQSKETENQSKKTGNQTEDIETESLANIKVNDTEIVNDTSLNFSIDPNTELDGYIKDVYWEFGDGDSDKGWFSIHRYTEPGNYTVNLSVFDNTGDMAEDSINITVNPKKEENDTDTVKKILKNKPVVIEYEKSDGYNKKQINLKLKDQTDPGDYIKSVTWYVDGEKQGTGKKIQHTFTLPDGETVADKTVEMVVKLRVGNQFVQNFSDRIDVRVSRFYSKGVTDIKRNLSQSHGGSAGIRNETKSGR